MFTELICSTQDLTQESTSDVGVCRGGKGSCSLVPYAAHEGLCDGEMPLLEMNIRDLFAWDEAALSVLHDCDSLSARSCFTNKMRVTANRLL